MNTDFNPNQQSKTLLIVVSFAIIYIVWGSTYLFASYALEQVAAFRLCAIRYTAAGLITFGLMAILFRPAAASLVEVKNAALAGLIFLGLGTGGAIWALNFLDTGLTALIISGEPLIIVLMMWLVNRKRPASQSFIGIALGMIGMYLLVTQQELVSNQEQWQGVLVIFLSMLAWGAGSIFVSKAKLPDSQWLNSAIQMTAGGLATYLISLMLGEPGVAFSSLNQKTIYSIGILIVFGSILAFTAFNFLLRNVSTEKVSTNTYVNPIIAMFLGYQFNDEQITTMSILAALIMLSGVFIINTNKDKIMA